MTSASAGPVSLLASWLDHDPAAASAPASAAAAAILARASPAVARRFLEHFAWDRSAAAQAMLATARWRALAAPWRDTARELPATLAGLPCFCAGHDADGRPVLVMRAAGGHGAGGVPAEAAPAGGADDHDDDRLRALVWALEAASGNGLHRLFRAAAGGAALPVSRGAISLVVDFSAPSSSAAPSSSVSVSFLRRAAALLLLRYPGTVARCLVLDAPPAVVALWSTVRSVLPPWVAAAVELCGGTASEEGISALRTRLGEAAARAVLAAYPDCGSLDLLEGAPGLADDGAEHDGDGAGRAWGGDGASLRGVGAWGIRAEGAAAEAAMRGAVAAARVADARAMADALSSAAAEAACASAARRRAEAAAEPPAGTPASAAASEPVSASAPIPPIHRRASPASGRRGLYDDGDDDILHAAAESSAVGALPGGVAARRDRTGPMPSPGSEGVEVVDWAAAVRATAQGSEVGASTPPEARSDPGSEDELTI